MPDTIRQLIDARAAEHPDRVFVSNPELNRDITYGALKNFADELGARLEQLGIVVGGKVAFLLDNGALVAPLFLGVMACNRVVVPLNAVAGPTQLQHVIQHSDVRLIFVAPHYRDQLARLLKTITRDIRVIIASDEHGLEWNESVATDTVIAATPPTVTDPALLLYTSGSTGKPKGALLSHAAVVGGGRNVVAGHGLTAHDRALCVLPVYHVNGAMVTVCAPLVSGGFVAMPRRFSARAFWQLAADYECTWTSVVPTMINYLLVRTPQDFIKLRARLKHFRFARSASAPLPSAVLQQWEKNFKLPMIETLGLTETAGTVATNPMPPAPRKLNSVGKACGVDMKIIDEHGNDCPPNYDGEIVIRGVSVLGEYYKDAANTRAAFVDGWFRSGDIGRLDDDGYLFITGRLKELILRGGENIAPREIDDALYQHEAVLEAAAVGVSHPNYGQEVVACVALRDGLECTEQTLIQFCAARVGEVKAPKKIYFLDELPKGPSGKILRLKLPEIISGLGKVGK